ncbi:MAG: hypothetical protein ACI9JN_001589, partial [Bacteroidia bacterium]
MKNAVSSILACGLLLFYFNPASAQIKLNGKSVICEGDLGSFTFIAPTGKTGSTYNWDFGETYT